MSHLGQRLSALIDGELDDSERERVLIHLSKCMSCRDEIAALRMLKRRMNAIGEAAADSGLAGRLMGLQDADADECQTHWPRSATSGGWLGTWHGNSRAGWYALGGSVAAVLAGLGTAAFIVGGPQDPSPEPSVTPSVDVYTMQHYLDNGWAPADSPETQQVEAPATESGGPGVREFRGLEVAPRSLTASYRP
jgi:anti-sigma factor RsiW